ncbi:MAG: hypothetical protein K8S99_17270 [Planctomycetes bacterium]|nr:hypothetical protein [Planctomycetota bacterium]
MFRALHQFVERVASPLPGWIFLSAGLALVGMAVLVPAWADVREMDWQVHVMRLQAEALQEQAGSYREFHAALMADDPVLLERLAYYHLRLKPAGSQQVLLSSHSPNRNTVEPHIPTVEELLHRPVPTPGVNMPSYKALDTRLIRLTRNGVTRTAMIAAGFFCLLAGITAIPLRIRDDADENASLGLIDETALPTGQSDETEPIVAQLDEQAESEIEEDAAVAVAQADDDQATEAVEEITDAPAEATPSWRDRLKNRVGSLPAIDWLRRRRG